MSTPDETLSIGRGERVLVYDDDQTIGTAASVILRAHGFDARPYLDDQSFLVSLRRVGATAAIVDFDVGIGYRERLDLARIVREERRHRGCVIVGVAHDVGWIDLDVVDFALSKPYVARDLAELLRGMIDLARDGRRVARCGRAIGGWRTTA